MVISDNITLSILDSSNNIVNKEECISLLEPSDKNIETELDNVIDSCDDTDTINSDNSSSTDYDDTSDEEGSDEFHQFADSEYNRFFTNDERIMFPSRKLRFKHPIIVALWQTEQEPTADFMNLYMTVFKEECDQLSNTGHSVLLDIDKLDLVWSLPADYMHGSLMGVTKQLYYRWTPSNVLSKQKQTKLKERMANIKLCQKLQRSLRPLGHVHKYKTLEWKIWLLFVSVPCLHKILPENLFFPYLRFVDSIYKLLQTNITQQEIDESEMQLLQFVGESIIEYGIEFATFNLHSLLHYTETVRLCGPLWAISAFPFESAIFKFTRQINAPNGSIKQIAEKWLQKDTFLGYLENNNHNAPNAVNYSKSVFETNQLVEKHVRLQNVVLIGNGVHNKKVEKIMRNFKRDDSLEVKTFNRCIYKSIVYHSANYNRVSKTNDSVVQLMSGKILEIHHFLKVQENCYICGCEWLITDIDFNRKKKSNIDKPIVKHILKVQEKKNFMIFGINDIRKKAICIDTGEKVYISFLPNDYETH
ncbi:hypothetical protein TKK_0015370 [Trichogramma kaykai]